MCSFIALSASASNMGHGCMVKFAGVSPYPVPNEVGGELSLKKIEKVRVRPWDKP